MKNSHPYFNMSLTYMDIDKLTSEKIGVKNSKSILTSLSFFNYELCSLQIKVGNIW